MGHKSERLELRLTEREIQILDQVRGPATRSAWIRHQITNAAGTLPDTQTIHDGEGNPVAILETPLIHDGAVQAVHQTVRANAAPAVTPAGKVDVPAAPAQHLHRYSQREQTGYAKGKMTHRWECVCGAEKDE